MPLESGQYYIFSAVGDSPVGRKPAEDKSLRPKGIYKLPDGSPAPVWDVQRLDDENYKLTTKGALVGAIAGHVFAFLITEEALGATTEWTLKSDERNPDGNAYIITKPDHQDGWVVSDDDFAPHVILRPIIAGLSLPPTYPLNEIFVFKKVDS